MIIFSTRMNDIYDVRRVTIEFYFKGEGERLIPVSFFEAPGKISEAGLAQDFGEFLIITTFFCSSNYKTLLSARGPR